MLLETKNITSGYGQIEIVHDVSIKVKEAEVLAIVGRNGVGKTTLIKTLIGALPALNGDIYFKDENITHKKSHERARIGIGYVPQGRGIFSTLTVKENLYMGHRINDGLIQAADYERIYRYFPILKERGSQMAGSFSGGQQQQLALGRALLGNPSLLLLDEPSEGIQPNVVRDMGLLLRSLRTEDHLTVIVVEQNLELIRLMADRCIVIDKGVVVAELQAEELADPDVARRYLAI